MGLFDYLTVIVVHAKVHGDTPAAVQRGGPGSVLTERVGFGALTGSYRRQSRPGRDVRVRNGYSIVARGAEPRVQEFCRFSRFGPRHTSAGK